MLGSGPSWEWGFGGGLHKSPVLNQEHIQPQKETRLCHEDAKSLDSPSCICVLGPSLLWSTGRVHPGPKLPFLSSATPASPSQLCAQALLPSCMEPKGTCLVGGVLVDDADVLTVREPQESEILGSLQVVPKVIKDLQ